MLFRIKWTLYRRCPWLHWGCINVVHDYTSTRRPYQPCPGQRGSEFFSSFCALHIILPVFRMAAEFPAELTAIPLEDIDPYYQNKKVRPLLKSKSAIWNSIPRWAKYTVFVIELNLLLRCFGLSALYLPTRQLMTHAYRPGITPPPYTKSMSLNGLSWFNSQRRCVPRLSYQGISFICQISCRLNTSFS